MIITRLRGGLGNQMFQYALGRVLSLSRSEKLKLDITGYEKQPEGDTKRAYRLDVFDTHAEIATVDEVRQAKYPYGIFSKVWRAFTQKVLKRYYVDYHPEIFRKKHIPYLDGFFQSEKYFILENPDNVHNSRHISGPSDFRQVIRNDFKIKPELVSERMKEVADTIRNTPTSVSIHVRRGDYVTNKTANSTQGVASIEYYKKAIDTVRQKNNNQPVTFFVFSDGIEWVKENLPIEDMYPNCTVVYVSGQAGSDNRNPLEDYEELTLMSLCHHNIIANSSFSWWAAWLNSNPQKTVIAPAQWTVKNTENPNLIPPEWIRL